MQRMIQVFFGVTCCLSLFGTRVLQAEDSAVASAPHSFEVARPAPWSAQNSYENYGGWLAASYLAVPLLAWGLPTLATDLKITAHTSAALALTGFAVGLSLPAITHWLHDESWLGWRAMLGLPLTMAAGLVVGFLLGGATGIVAGLLGGILAIAGGVGWMVFDVSDTATERKARRNAARAMQVLALPRPGGGLVALSGAF